MIIIDYLRGLWHAGWRRVSGEPTSSDGSADPRGLAAWLNAARFRRRQITEDAEVAAIIAFLEANDPL